MHANGSLDASDFVIANLADTSVPTFTLSLLANQQVEFNYQGVSSGDGLGTGIQGAIGSAANLSLNVPFTNPGTSPFDLALPSFGRDQAAAQISRGNAPWNDVLGSPHSLTYSYRATSAGVSYTNGASGFTQFNAAEIAAAEAAIQLWEDVANITLTRVRDPGSEYSDSGQFLLWNYASSTAGSQAANASGFGGQTFSGGAWHFTSISTTIARCYRTDVRQRRLPAYSCTKSAMRSDCRIRAITTCCRAERASPTTATRSTAKIPTNTR